MITNRPNTLNAASQRNSKFQFFLCLKFVEAIWLKEIMVKLNVLNRFGINQEFVDLLKEENSAVPLRSVVQWSLSTLAGCTKALFTDILKALFMDLNKDGASHSIASVWRIYSLRRLRYLFREHPRNANQSGVSMEHLRKSEVDLNFWKMKWMCDQLRNKDAIRINNQIIGENL